MVAEYTIAAVVASIAVVLLEFAVLRTGLFRLRRYWLTIAITLGFQIPVDGWLTRPEATIVAYNDDATIGIRAPWNIPIEDFGFGFALITFTLLMWQWHQRRQSAPPSGTWHQHQPPGDA